MVTTATRPMVMQGVIAGLIAGVVFAAFEMFASAILAGMGAFFMPLRMISAIVLGEAVLDPAYPLLAPMLVGTIVHFALSAAFGVLFVLAAPAAMRLTRGAFGVVMAATIYGFLLWIVNFYVIAPIAGWHWFAGSSVIVQFLAHTFCFGTALGVYLNSDAALAHAGVHRTRGASDAHGERI